MDACAGVSTGGAGRSGLGGARGREDHGDERWARPGSGDGSVLSLSGSSLLSCRGGGGILVRESSRGGRGLTGVFAHLSFTYVQEG